MTAHNPVMGMTSHTWTRGSLMYATSPPMWDWTCTKCHKVTTAFKPPLEECPERVKRLMNQRLM